MDARALGEIIGGVSLFAGKHLADIITDRRRDLVIDQKLEKMSNTIRLELQALRIVLIGIDGDNGIRGDLRQAEDRIDGLEERELARIERRRPRS